MTKHSACHQTYTGNEYTQTQGLPPAGIDPVFSAEPGLIDNAGIRHSSTDTELGGARIPFFCIEQGKIIWNSKSDQAIAVADTVQSASIGCLQRNRYLRCGCTPEAQQKVPVPDRAVVLVFSGNRVRHDLEAGFFRCSQ